MRNLPSIEFSASVHDFAPKLICNLMTMTFASLGRVNWSQTYKECWFYASHLAFAITRKTPSHCWPESWKYFARHIHNHEWAHSTDGSHRSTVWEGRTNPTASTNIKKENVSLLFFMCDGQQWLLLERQGDDEHANASRKTSNEHAISSDNFLTASCPFGFCVFFPSP